MVHLQVVSICQNQPICRVLKLLNISNIQAHNSYNRSTLHFSWSSEKLALRSHSQLVAISINV